jgi:pectate lyase
MYYLINSDMKATYRLFRWLIIPVSVLIIGGMRLDAKQPAFPGAEGYGKYASGGRGGRIIEVTTLEDRDRYGNIAPGSFREALSTEGDDPITIVFRVSGIIELNGELKSKRSNMTIAGQTAPGDGICFKDASIKLSGNNLIIRYLRFRPGDETREQVSGLNIENAKNIIIDHCSMSWSIEENATFYDNKYTTVQWCIISESLYDSYHSKGARGYAGQWGGQYATYHHNLIAHNRSRSPRINGCRSHDTVALLDFRNNVIYNWGSSGAIYGGEVEIYYEDPENPGTNLALCHTTFVNNYYQPGPATSGTLLFAAPSYVSEGNTAQGYAGWYFSGNYMEGTDGGMNDDNWLGVDGSRVGGIENIKSTTEFVAEAVTTESAMEAFVSVLEKAGAIMPERDTVDARIVAETRGEIAVTGDGTLGTDEGIIDSQDAVGGWPEYLTPPGDKIPADSDKDGMPDYWELENGLDPEDAEDGKTITGDGYSNLEHYLNSDIPYIATETGIETSMVSQTLSIFPVPAKHYINIVCPEPIISVRLFDNSGKLVFHDRTCSETLKLNTGHLNPGIYIIQATFKNGTIAQRKFINQ